MEVIERPVNVQDFLATIAVGLGLDTRQADQACWRWPCWR
jgi:hypothetical protein